MTIHLTPELEAKLNALAADTGRSPDELAADAIAGYIEDLAEVRAELDRRYDDYKSGKVRPVDGKAYFERLRQREEALLKKPGPAQ